MTKVGQDHMLCRCDCSPYSSMLLLYMLGKVRLMKSSFDLETQQTDCLDVRPRFVVLPFKLAYGRWCTVASAKQIACQSTFKSCKLCLVSSMSLSQDNSLRSLTRPFSSITPSLTQMPQEPIIFAIITSVNNLSPTTAIWSGLVTPESGALRK